jgi:hypothetical protein
VARVRLRGGAVSPEQQQAHDRHRPWVVLPVLAVLAVYCWCYTHVARWCGALTPADVAARLGLALPRVLDDDGNIDAKLQVSRTALLGNDDERLLVFAVLFACFLSVYFLPIRHKRAAIVAWFLVGFTAVFGLAPALTVLTAHLAIWLAFHPTHRHGPRLAGAFAALAACLALVDVPPIRAAPVIALAALVGAPIFRRLAPTLAAGGRLVAALRTALIQACMLTLVVAAAWHGLTGAAWKLPVGRVFYLYQWARLMVYHADYADGQVPKDLGPIAYLSIFLSPAGIFNMTHAPYLGQAHVYLEQRFLAEDKSALVLSGVRLWCLALIYMVFAEQAIAAFVAVARELLGTPVYAFTSELVREHLRGEQLSSASVLLSTLVDQARIFLIYGGVTHFRVGTWRIFGYAMEPQYDRPWLATNLATLWGRFAFHFREFLVRVFYYPVFLRCFRRRPVLRIFFATMVATVVGNLVWGHIPPALLGAPTWNTLTAILSTWPYFVLLGLGISLTQVWLLRRPRSRRPWTRDRRFVLDLVCAYLTLQYFALIHIYIRPQPGGSLAQSTRLVWIGLGFD